jgi:hypothetical protein
MKIVGIEGLTDEQIHLQIARGARFVHFQYCVSVILMTFKRPSDIYFVRAGESAVGTGLRFTLLSLLAGWWGIPWGPIYTIQSLWVNLSGGRDITNEVLASVTPAPVPPAAVAPAG